MKIAISSTGKNINDKMSDTFGRCPYFIIAEISSKGGSASGGKDGKIIKFEAIENTNANQAGGAGISAAKLIVEKDVEALITKEIGPRALDVLKQFNIKIYYKEGIIEEVLQNFKK